ncbi:MAG TPA: hypothetical protein VLV86_12335 [Vicinamibacterales bacterium]|nr:hypothetical protein [Vicinamibacterales bacterium]
MHRDLEAVVAADEECRSRLTLAESRRERDIAAARATCDAAIEQRRAAAIASLEQELAAIRAGGDARVAEVRQKQTAYLAALAKRGEDQFDLAVQRYLSIVGATVKP